MSTLREGDTVWPHAYFITFSCYGTWLHGDTRGSVDTDHNIPGTPFLDQDAAREQAEFARLRHAPVRLTVLARRAVDSAIRGVCAHREWLLHALNVRTTHVHVVVGADRLPEEVMNTFKSWATRRLREAGLVSAGAKVWSRHGSTRYLWTSDEVEASVRYVEEGQDGRRE